MSDSSLETSGTLTYPLLPLRDVVVFPHMVIPLFVGRPKSIKALEVAMESGKHVLLVAQKSAAKDDPTPEDLYDTGCGYCVADAQTAGWHRQGPRRGLHRAFTHGVDQ